MNKKYILVCACVKTKSDHNSIEIKAFAHIIDEASTLRNILTMFILSLNLLFMHTFLCDYGGKPINIWYFKIKSGENDHENMHICKQKIIPHKRDNTKIHTVCNIWLMVLWLSDTCSICAAIC